MIRKSGIASWPPVWTTTRLNSDTPTGEIGFLERAMMHELFDKIIFLFVEHQGQRYMGSMQFDDPQFCYQIYAVLLAKVGLSIQEIGDLDVSHLL